MALDPQKEKRFGLLALQRGLVTEAELASCEAKQKALLEQGQERRLGEVMIMEKVLSKAQALAVLKAVHLESGEKPRIGGFELIEKLGEGGMGVVYRARQLSMDREVALKLLPRRLSEDPVFVERFMREAKLSAKLSHVNVVRAIDVGESNGYHFFAMEFVDGESLRERIDRHKKLTEADVIRIAIQAVQGLQHASEMNITHRDIKPANIMICSDEVVKIADMGLAVVTGQSSLTNAGNPQAVGTPYYMSPEQAEGKSNIDFRADIYALGATLFEAATGERPFTGSNVPAIMAKRLYSPPPIASTVNSEITQGLSAVIYKMMARQPDDRYADFASLLDDLALVSKHKLPSCINILPHKKKPVSRKMRSQKVRRKKRQARRTQLALRQVRANLPRQSRRPRQHVQKGPDIGMIAMGVGALVLVISFSLLIKYRHALAGPKHPARNVVWATPVSEESDGQRIRALWEDAQKQERSLLQNANDTVSRTRLLGIYQKLMRTYPASAYAREARQRLVVLGEADRD